MSKVTYRIDEQAGDVIFQHRRWSNAVAHPIRTFTRLFLGPMSWRSVRVSAEDGCPWSLAYLVARDELIDLGLINA